MRTQPRPSSPRMDLAPALRRPSPSPTASFSAWGRGNRSQPSWAGWESRPLWSSPIPDWSRRESSPRSSGSITRAVLFEDVQANPTEADVLAGLARYRDAGCDGLIGLGGGSAIDAAKAIRLLVTHSGPPCRLRLHPGGTGADQARSSPDARHPHDGGDGQRGRAGNLDPASPDRPQDDRPVPASPAVDGDLRPRAHRGLPAGLDGGNRDGRLDPLRGELPGDHRFSRSAMESPSRACGTSSTGWKRPCATVPTSTRGRP